MEKKNIYFVQVGFAFDNSLYLPYAVGTLAAFAFNDEKIKNEYEIGEFFFKREKLGSIVSRLKKPYLVAFSCYIWNYEFNKALAKAIKAAYPECFIVFGGHNVSEDSLPEEEFIDIFMFGEGEEPFAQLLKALPRGELASVPNIAFRSKNEILRTPKKLYTSLDSYPSPYLTGIFDRIIEENPGVDFLTVLETNRGCPYSCAYCDWCAGKKVRFFPLKKVLGEIEWLSKNRVEYCFCADSNFGMFERDAEIVKRLTAAKEQTGYPKVFRPCYAKDSDERVFEICRLLNSHGMDKGATMAYQTLSGEALENINRKNLTMEHFSDLMKLYGENHIPTYSELILGLPGETYESFCAGLCRLLDAGQHNSVSVYYCELLPNSPMAQADYIKKHGIISQKVAFNHIHSAAHAEEVPEYSTIVVGTATMSREMWVKANIFSICVQCFHNLGLLRCFALYLKHEKGIGYHEFYNSLLAEILSSEGTLCGSLFKGFEASLSSADEQWNYRNPALGEAAWFFEEGAFLEVLMNYERFIGEITPFLKSFGIDGSVFPELLRYQREVIRYPGKNSFSIETSYDFYSYFEGIYTGKYAGLKKMPSHLHFEFGDGINDFCTYARELVWYGRRKGATFATGNPNAIK